MQNAAASYGRLVDDSTGQPEVGMFWWITKQELSLGLLVVEIIKKIRIITPRYQTISCFHNQTSWPMVSLRIRGRWGGKYLVELSDKFNESDYVYVNSLRDDSWVALNWLTEYITIGPTARLLRGRVLMWKATWKNGLWI